MTNTKINRLLIIAIIGIIVSSIGAVIGAIIYGHDVLVMYLNIIGIMAIVEILFEHFHKTNNQEASKSRLKFSSKILITVDSVLLFDIIADNFGSVAGLLAAFLICLFVEKVAFKYIDEIISIEL